MRFFYDPFDKGGGWQEGKWNSFDLFVVIVTIIPFFITPSVAAAREAAMSEDSDLSGFAPVLRLLRLARLLKIFKSVAQLQVILRGLARGIQSVVYVSLMLVL